MAKKIEVLKWMGWEHPAIYVAFGRDKYLVERVDNPDAPWSVGPFSVWEASDIKGLPYVINIGQEKLPLALVQWIYKF